MHHRIIRCVSFLYILFAHILFLFSEETVFKQYQTFNWAPIANARTYVVDVEKEQDENNWIPEQKLQTKTPHLEMLLYPGKYRVSISAYNMLNKRGSTSKWVSFIILDEKEPFLQSSSFEKESAEQTAGTDSSPAERNIVQIKGKNIFFGETYFTLTPISADKTPAGGIVSYIQNRQPVPLKIARRNRVQEEVIATYDDSLLFSGSYTLQANNPGGLTSSINVNVTTDRAPVIMPEQYEINTLYQVHAIKLTRGSKSTFTVKGTDFSSNTSFSFKPAQGIPYPWTTVNKQREVPLTVDSFTSNGNVTTAQLAFDSSLIETGYYMLTAVNPNDAAATSVLMLITVLPDPEVKKPVVSSIKAKSNKKKNTIEFTVEGTNLDSDAAAALVAPFSTETGTNNRIPLTLIDFENNKKKLLFSIPGNTVLSGPYAFLLETNGCSVITYLTFGKNLALSVVPLTPEESDKLYLRSTDQPIPEIEQTGKLIELTQNFPLNQDIWSDRQSYSKKTSSDNPLVQTDKNGVQSVGREINNSFIIKNYYLFDSNSTEDTSMWKTNGNIICTIEDGLLHIKTAKLIPANESWNITYTKPFTINDKQEISLTGEALVKSSAPDSSAALNVNFNTDRFYSLTYSSSSFSSSEWSSYQTTFSSKSSLPFSVRIIGNGNADFYLKQIVLSYRNLSTANSFAFKNMQYKVSTSNLESLALFNNGDSVKFKFTTNQDINRWSAEFYTKTTSNDDTWYDCPLEKYSKLISSPDSPEKVYLFDAKYTSFKRSLFSTGFGALDVRDAKSFSLVMTPDKKYPITTYKMYDMQIYESSSKPTKLIKQNPVFFTHGQINVLYSNDSLKAGLSVTPIDFRWISTQVSAAYNIDKKIINGDASLVLAIPSQLLQPYIGAGIGVTMDDTYITPDEYYIPAFAGIRLANFIDVRYTCSLNQFAGKSNNESRYFKDEFYLGISLWNRPRKIKRVPKE